MRATSVRYISISEAYQDKPIVIDSLCDADIYNYCPRGTALEDSLSDSWFFIAPPMTDPIRQSFVKTDSGLVRPGDCFGFRAKFTTVKYGVTCRTAIKGPSSEKFELGETTRRVHKSGENENSISFEQQLDGRADSFSMHWTAPVLNSIGEYELNVYLENKHVFHFKFKVLAVENRPKSHFRSKKSC